MSSRPVQQARAVALRRVPQDGYRTGQFLEMLVNCLHSQAQYCRLVVVGVKAAAEGNPGGNEQELLWFPCE